MSLQNSYLRDWYASSAPIIDVHFVIVADRCVACVRIFAAFEEGFVGNGHTHVYCADGYTNGVKILATLEPEW